MQFSGTFYNCPEQEQQQEQQQQSNPKDLGSKFPRSKTTPHQLVLLFTFVLTGTNVQIAVLVSS